jgi:pimeloyl-ACP methyl ester carboxylesterase
MQQFQSGYSEVNGLKMYYEIHGVGKPLVLIHGGGSTLESSFGNLIPLLSQSRQIIAVEMQAHGRTADRDTPLSFEQDADDVAALLHNLQIEKADVLGFSNGGQTTVELALRHGEKLNKIILASIIYKRSGTAPQFWDGFEDVTIDVMPPALAEAFFRVNNSQEAFEKMFHRDVNRMKNFRGWTDEQMGSIKVPTLIINGNHDVGTVEHAVEMYRTIPNAKLAIVPGGHGEYLGAAEEMNGRPWKHPYIVGLIQEFLEAD